MDLTGLYTTPVIITNTNRSTVRGCGLLQRDVLHSNERFLLPPAQQVVCSPIPGHAHVLLPAFCSVGPNVTEP